MSDHPLKKLPVARKVADPNSLMTEQFRKLRSILCNPHMFRAVRSILVTSCLPGEGKTTTALNLAATMAKAPGASVLLVDADLRKKSLTRLLGLRAQKGLSDLLNEGNELGEAFIQTDIAGLRVLPAGITNGNPAELIASDRMEILLRQLGEQQRESFLFIDSSPIVSTSEPNVLSHLVDGVIMVIMADKTRRDMVKREIRNLDAQRLLGVVLNCADFESNNYYHKYYKYGTSDEKR